MRPPARRVTQTGLLILLAAALAVPACRKTPDPLVVNRDRIVVSNLTNEPWTNVELSLNGYYRATASALAPGGKLDAPLARFQTGLGHYLDTRRERVRHVKVTARTAGGTPVELTWPSDDTRGATKR